MWPGVTTAGYCPLGAVEEKAQKALPRCIIPLSHMNPYRPFPQPSKSISISWTHYNSSNTILTIHPNPSPTIYPIFLSSSRGWFNLKQMAITTKRSSCILGQKMQLWHKMEFLVIETTKNSISWQFYTNILEQKCTFVTKMHFWYMIK